jgi:tetratricopeptide (TPR) repeat protein
METTIRVCLLTLVLHLPLYCQHLIEKTRLSCPSGMGLHWGTTMDKNRVRRSRATLIFLMLTIAVSVNSPPAADAASDAAAFLQKGINDLQSADYQEPLKNCDRAIVLNPKYAEAYFYRGNAYVNLGKPGQEIKEYDKAIGLNLKYTEARTTGRQRKTCGLLPAVSLETGARLLKSKGTGW